MLDALLSRPPPRAPPTPDRAPLSTLANGQQPRSASGAVKPTTTTDAEPSPTLGLSALMSRTSGEGRLSDLAPPPPNSVLHVPVLFDERDSRTSSVSGIAISEEADEPADLRGVKNGSWVSAGSPLSRQYTVFVPEHDRYSVGGTAFGGYEGFGGGGYEGFGGGGGGRPSLAHGGGRPSIAHGGFRRRSSQVFPGRRSSIAMPSAAAPPPPPTAQADSSSGGASVNALIPAATRALMLEERVRELEARNYSLHEQIFQLRHEALSERDAKQLKQRLSAAPAPKPPSIEAGSQAGGSHHPCFGRLVADLGFKQIYVASARTLVNTVPIWSKQRPCNEGRVDEIVRLKASQPELMGPVMCFEFFAPADALAQQPSLACPQPRAIFDGQHRARAAMRLLASTEELAELEKGGAAPAAAASASASTVAQEEEEDEEETYRATGLVPLALTRDRREPKQPQPFVAGPASQYGDSPWRRRKSPMGLDNYAFFNAAPSTSSSSAPAPPPAPPPKPPPAPPRKHADFSMIVEVYPVRDESDIKRLYLEVNKGESVKEIDLPDQLAPERKLVIDGACALLQKAYPEMHKPSDRCRPPHVHRDTLRNKLFHTPAAHQAGTAEELHRMLLRVNDRLRGRPYGQWPSRVRDKPLKKAKQHGLFLGLDEYAWLDLLGQV